MLALRRRLLAAGLAAAAAALFGARALAQEKVIRVTARRFEFSPSDIELKKGEPVVLEFTTADVLMGFSLPDFKLRTDIPPGQVARLRFTPDRVGSFEFVCDNFCGEFHEDMSGKIRVTA
ncbi:MAG TPA: cupredoxin domain-containing protein [Burkholderiales bacterium]|nr:cupredoxin domain-containing protein [Burkholderiales bacterium]